MQDVFINDDEGRIRAGWRIIGQVFLMFLIGYPLSALFNAILPVGGMLVYGLSMLIGALASTWAAAIGLDHRKWAEFGVSFNKKWVIESIVGFLLAGGAITVIFLIEYGLNWVEVIGYGWQLTPDEPFVLTVMGYLLFMMCVGFYEELVFRGYQIINLSEGFNGWATTPRNSVIYAILFSSILFGVGHSFNPNATWYATLNVTVAGLMLAFPFITTGRLSYSVGLHAGWNFFQGGVYGFAVSGLKYQASIIRIEQDGPIFMTGGMFGPEAGLLGLLGMGLIVAGVIGIFKFNNQRIAVYKWLAWYERSEEEI